MDGSGPALASLRHEDGEPEVIEELHIRGLGVIEDVSLVLGPGLTVVTGETGAGKTLLVTALQLLLGGRASSDLVRTGHEAAAIEALVRLPATDPRRTEDVATADGRDMDADPSGGVPYAELHELAEDGVLIVSREIPATGRSRARIGGRLVPSSDLSALMGSLVEIHGQHEHVRLERPAVQRRLLDAYGDEEHLRVLATHRAAHASWSAADRRRALLEEDATERTRRIARLRAERAEIDAVRLDPASDGDLDRDIERLANADGLRTALEGARAAAGAGGALDALGIAVAALRRAPGGDVVVLGLAERMVQLSRELSDVVADVAALADDLEADDARLDALQLRKRDVVTLQRRFGPTIEAILEHREAVDAQLSELETVEHDADAVLAELTRADEAMRATARDLTASRTAVADRLSAAVRGHLVELGLPHAELLVEVRPAASVGPDGGDQVAFLLAANPGETPARLADAASGGERSRVALALEVVLADAERRRVLVFDEVDAGIGGSTALAVGEKLASLTGQESMAQQVLCVTHLPQVAAYADAHHVVEKQVVGGRTVTRVRHIPEEERAEVLSHMLGGEATAHAGLAHARGLLRAAEARRSR